MCLCVYFFSLPAVPQHRRKHRSAKPTPTYAARMARFTLHGRLCTYRNCIAYYCTLGIYSTMSTTRSTMQVLFRRFNRLSRSFIRPVFTDYARDKNSVTFPRFSSCNHCCNDNNRFVIVTSALMMIVSFW